MTENKEKVYYPYGDNNDLLIEESLMDSLYEELKHQYYFEKAKHELRSPIQKFFSLSEPYELRTLDDFVYKRNKPLWYALRNRRLAWKTFIAKEIYG